MISIFNYIVSNITNLKGKTSRAKYWQIFLVVFVIGFILETIARQTTGISLIQRSFHFEYINFLQLVLFVLFNLINLVLCVFQIRRLNDIWLPRWIVLINIIPIVGPSIMTLLMLKKGTVT